MFVRVVSTARLGTHTTLFRTQARVHHFKPWPNAAEAEGLSEGGKGKSGSSSTGEEQKEEPRGVVDATKA